MDDKVTKIFLDRLIKDVTENNTLPWERPVNYFAFNYFSLYEYTGINRWLLPQGEYMTENQIREYNKKTGKNFRYQKGTIWFPVYFSKEIKEIVSQSSLPDSCDVTKNGYIGRDKYYYYIHENNAYFKCRRVRRYYTVAERSNFISETGETLPSRISSGEVVVLYSKPNEVIKNYLDREGIKVINDTYNDGGYYDRVKDVICIPNAELYKSSNRYCSTWFHEIIHSTGNSKRLNRIGISIDKDLLDAEIESANNTTRKYIYSKEECIAELGCSLLCSETGVQKEDMCDDAYKNHVAYIQSWIKYFQSNKDDIISVMSSAEKAFKFVLSRNTGGTEDGAEPI